MLGVVFQGQAERVPLGDDALWVLPGGWRPAGPAAVLAGREAV